jgi:hypothetical protein
MSRSAGVERSTQAGTRRVRQFTLNLSSQDFAIRLIQASPTSLDQPCQRPQTQAARKRAALALVLAALPNLVSVPALARAETIIQVYHVVCVSLATTALVLAAAKRPSAAI